jgi:hypothetical protein
MNCAEVRLHLPAFLYGDLKPDEAVAIEEHLRACAGCRAESAALGRLQPLLDVVPAPPMRIDLPRLYQEAGAQHERRLRRWRRAALAVMTAAAAAILIIGLLRLEVRVEAHQVVLRWGAPPAMPELAPQPVAPQVIDEPRPVAVNPAPTQEMENQLKLVTELTQLLASEIETRDRRQGQEIARLQGRMQELHHQMAQWRVATERDVAALYAGQYLTSKKGMTP